MGKKLQIIFCLLFSSFFSYFTMAQSCVKIESILVAACLSTQGTEGSNEMMRFRVGPNDLNTADMNITWGSGQYSYAGLAQNATTANLVSQMNASIQACGFLKEPTNGILPANSKVLIICGLNVSVTANPFTNLSDTLYVIFQNSSQPGGHFLNYSINPPAAGTIDQTTTISFSNIANCSSSATYFRNLLVTSSGANGNEPGATVNFDENMNATYFNNGCSAPVTPYSANWNSPQAICDNNAINLNDYITGTQGGVWTGQGVTGSIFDPTGLTGSISITYTVSPNVNCPQLQPVSQTQSITVSQPGDASWAPPAFICAGGGLVDLNNFVTGTPGGIFIGANINNNQLNTVGLGNSATITYTVGVPPCQVQNQQIVSIINLPPPTITGITDYCNANASSPLSATALTGANIVWFDASNNQVGSGESFTPPFGVNATYTAVQQTSACSSSTSTVSINFLVVNAPTGNANYTYCQGNIPPFLTATSNDSIIWFSDIGLTTQVGTGSSFTAPTGSNQFYAIAQEGSCQSTPLVVSVTEDLPLTAEITTTILSLCQVDTVILQSANVDLNSWSTGEFGPTLAVTLPGTYTLTRTNACNTATDQVEVTGLAVNAAFTVSEEEGFSPLSVSVTDNSFGGDICNWTLNNNAVNIQNLVLTEPGEYNLIHSCSNSEGCADQDSVLIVVKSAELEVLVPNVFTPNGDGYNDVFKVKSENVKTFSGVIFNRWGNKIFEWSDAAQGWDGGSSPDSTYFYIIKGTSIKDEAFERKGYVHLISKK